MGIVSTIPEKCRRCYTCIRECPAKAIKVENGQATVIKERCIVCGNCVKICAQSAKRIQDDTPDVRAMLKDGAKVFACLAPSFAAAFDTVAPGRVIGAVRSLGFAEVWEVAFGAELVSRAYARLFAKAKETGACVIATPCPAIVSYVEKYMPALHDSLAPIVSPMIAVARAVRKRHGADAKIVFIGPCVAKKNEVRDPCVSDNVDAVLTFEELRQMLKESGCNPATAAESDFDGPRACLGRSFSISGGLLKTSGLSTDILENDIVVTEGKDRVLEALNEVAAGKSQARFFDVLFCEGCINGPMMLNDLSLFVRKERLANFVKDQTTRMTRDEVEATLAEFADLDLGRMYTRQDLTLAQPSEETISKALAAMKKTDAVDQLNCGACGYRSCREKAIAVCQGLAEAEMCLPYLVEELEATIVRLARSNEDLASAQERLVQTERLASMGQLSAGVAHELNNPLGTILLYSHVLLKELKDGQRAQGDLQLIVSEAVRCKDIVRGLLDFARQSRVSKSPVDLAKLIDEVTEIMAAKAREAGVRVERELPAPIPTMLLDRVQIKQMLVNLVANGIDAVRPGGFVRVAAHLNPRGDQVEMNVVDNGCGIPREHLSRLFTPFFTTKEMGKGTGLGLAIAYGVVKMHSGDIAVESEEGQGTTFTVRLPLQREEARSDQ